MDSWVLLALGTGLFLSPACSKKNAVVPNCKIISASTVSAGNTSNTSFSYDNDGQVSIIQNTTGSATTTSVYTYSVNLILITTSNSGPVSEVDTIRLNNSGQIIYHYAKYFVNNEITIRTYTYNSDGQVLTQAFTDNNGQVVTGTYTYSGGDLTTISNGNPTQNTTYTYFTDKPFQNGDVLQFSQLISTGGVQYIKNVHLVKSIQQGTNFENFNYNFDSGGKITSVTLTTGSTIETISYQYQCH
jgi:hypothetical protein